MPQHKLMRQDHGGQPVFLYAGSQSAYRSFQKQVAEQDVADEKIDAADTMQLSTDPDWLNVDSFGDGDGAPWW